MAKKCSLEICGPIRQSKENEMVHNEDNVILPITIRDGIIRELGIKHMPLSTVVISRIDYEFSSACF